MNLFESIFNEANFSAMEPRALRGRPTDYYMDLTPSKDLRSISSVARAKSTALKAATGKSTKDYSVFVRNCFTDLCNFEDKSLYRNVSVTMRNILNAEATEDDVNRTKDQLRNGEKGFKPDDADYTNVDKIVLAELAAIWGLSRYTTTSDRDTLIICETAAETVAAKYKFSDKESFEEEIPDHMVYELETNNEFKGTRNSVPADLGSNPSTDAVFNYALGNPNESYKDTYNRALNYTQDELEADGAARKKARQVKKDRDDAKADERRAKADAIKDKRDRVYDKAFKAAGGTEVDKLVRKYYSAMAYAVAGWDYSNVDHDAEEAAAESIKKEAIEEYGQEAWDEAVEKAGTFNDFFYQGGSEKSPFKIADEKVDSYKKKYPNFMSH